MKWIDKDQKNFLKKFVPASAFIAGLCCFTPVILVLLGLGSASFAASLSDTLYGTYKWAFRAAGFVFLLGSLMWYAYKKENICSLDDFSRKRRKILNLALIAVIISILAYVVWLYVIVELIGIMLGIWG